MIFNLIILILLLIYYYKHELKYLYDRYITKFNNIKIDVTDNTPQINKLNICILSMDNRDLEYIQLHKKSWEKYSKLHGYKYIFENQCTNLPVYFCKYQRILELMDTTNYEYYIWVDSDTIVNKKYINYTFENMVNKVGTDTDLITSYPNSTFDPNNLFDRALVGSFYMFKNNNQSRELLQRCIDYIDISKWDNLSKGDCRYAGYCYEEAALFYSINDSINHKRIYGNFISNKNYCDNNYFIIHNNSKDGIEQCFIDNS